MNIKVIWKILALPLTALLFFLLFILFWNLLDLPKGENLIQVIRNYFDIYGYWILLMSAIIEGMLLFGLYYPGSFVIFIGVTFAGRDLEKIGLAVSSVTAGLFIAYLLNYLFGKYGWYRIFLRVGLEESLEKIRKRLEGYHFTGLLMNYWQPNLAAITSTAAGVLRFPFKKFLTYSLFSIIIWNTLWTTLIYFLGERVLVLFRVEVVLMILVGWLLFIFITKRKLIFNQKNAR